MRPLSLHTDIHEIIIMTHSNCSDACPVCNPGDYRPPMNIKKYYTAPPQEIFDDIQENAIQIWETYDNEYGYATEKITRVEDMKNIQDNAWAIVAMFDSSNIAKLLTMVKPETGAMILDAMKTP
jgi:hypothetical protein